MDVVEKLQVMLPHWVEHNRSHAKEFSEWSAQVATTDSHLAAHLDQAVTALQQAQKALEKALELCGGAMCTDAQSQHHHHH